MARTDDDSEFRLRPPKPRVARNEGAAWSNGFRLLMHYARSSRKTRNRARRKRERPASIPSALRGPGDYLKNKIRGQWKAHGRYLARESATFENDAKAVGFERERSKWTSHEAPKLAGRGRQQIWKLIVSPEFGDRVDCRG